MRNGYIASKARFLAHNSRPGRPSSIVIVGRTRMVGGNTYHSATVYADGVEIGRTAVHPGGGREYVYNGMALLLAVYPDLPDPEQNAAPWRYLSDLGIPLATEAIPVARKVDL